MQSDVDSHWFGWVICAGKFSWVAGRKASWIVGERTHMALISIAESGTSSHAALCGPMVLEQRRLWMAQVVIICTKNTRYLGSIQHRSMRPLWVESLDTVPSRKNTSSGLCGESRHSLKVVRVCGSRRGMLVCEYIDNEECYYALMVTPAALARPAKLRAVSFVAAPAESMARTSTDVVLAARTYTKLHQIITHEHHALLGAISPLTPCR